MPNIIFSCPFTGKTPYGLNQSGFRGDEWYAHRAEMFERFTLENLKKQTDQDFIWWGQFRKEEKDNPITKRIRASLEKSNIKYVMTFDGPIMMEDRALWHNIDLLERSVRSLEALQSMITDEWVYEVNLDSDDMVSKDFVALLKSKEPKERKAWYLQNGYMYCLDDRMGTWCNPHSMSIYTICYPAKTFLDPLERWKYQSTTNSHEQFPTFRGLNSHEQIPLIFDAEKLDDGLFCCVNHGGNISTIWEHPFRKEEIYNDSEKTKILSKFL